MKLKNIRSIKSVKDDPRMKNIYTRRRLEKSEHEKSKGILKK